MYFLLALAYMNCQSEKRQFGNEMEFPRKIGTKLPQPVQRMPVKTGPFNFEGNPSIDADFRRPDPPRPERHGDAGQDCHDHLPLAAALPPGDCILQLMCKFRRKCGGVPSKRVHGRHSASRHGIDQTSPDKIATCTVDPRFGMHTRSTRTL